MRGAVTRGPTGVGPLGVVSVAQAQALLKSPVPLFDHFASASTTSTDGTENDLHSDTIAAGQLATNGDKLCYRAAFSYAPHTTATRRLKIYFGGTALLDTSTPTAFSGGARLVPEVWVVRVSASVVRYMVQLAGTSLAGGATLGAGLSGEITGLTLANTQVMKAAGIAAGTGAASGDISQTLGQIHYFPAA